MREKRFLFRAALLLPFMSGLLRARGFRRAVAYVDRRAPAPPSGSQDLARARRLAYVVKAAATRGIVSFSCLEESLVLLWLLRREGFAPKLRLGGRTMEAAVDAHAWVELDGAVLNDSDDVAVRYPPFHRFDAASESAGK